MKIQWLGHSSFRILGSKSVITDPFGEIGLCFPEVRADIVTVSHGHYDHSAVEAVKGEPAIVDDAGPHRVADVLVTGYNTSHDDAQGALRGGNIVFVINMDGVKVAHLGDLGCIPDHNVLGALQNAKQKGLTLTDDCSAVEALGMTVLLTDGSEENLKITTPLDLEIAELILKRREET